MFSDHKIRNAAFDWLNQQTEIYGDVLTRVLLEHGYNYQGKRITLLGPKGIWKPAQMQLPLSIATIPDGPYGDFYNTKYGLLNYKYRGTDPNHPDNTGLRQLMDNRIPLIYFHRIYKGKYLATWPVFITGEIKEDYTFTVAVDDISYIQKDSNSSILAAEPEESYARRSYITTNFKRRIHQRSFRERVLMAYRESCAICQLRHRELLDAAHIIPDIEDQGLPIVKNGVSLCKIHHAAFDSNIIGINPNYYIKIREDILEEHDGPMLKHGLQELENHKIYLPNNKNEWPDRDRLNERYKRFLRAG